MGAINYSRSRLKIVYPFEGHDASKSEVKTVPAQSITLTDVIEFVEDPEYLISNTTSSIGFGTVFADANVGAPNVFTVEVSGSQQQLGNMYISTVSTASVSIAQSNENQSSFAALAMVVL